VIAAAGDGRVLGEVIALLAEHCGLRADSLRAGAVRRIVDALLATGMSPPELLDRVRAGGTPLTAQLLEAATVRETYFFRQPEHFQLVAELEVDHGGEIRGWSAGCATGEEAYSLAAALRAGARGRRPIRVLGTDVVESCLGMARAAVYGPRSVRVSGPLLFPLFDAGRDGKDVFEVDSGLRSVTTFAKHNLLDPAPGSDFDVILCRNALLYFDEAAARRACEHLARALAPDGILLFAPLDPVTPPRGLVSVGIAGAQVFTRHESMQKIRVQMESGRHRVSVPAGAASASGAPASPAAVSTHTGILECLEQGDIAGARSGLEELERIAPHYLPGMMERALWHRRRGEHTRCRALVRDVLDQARLLAPDAVVDGPEPLPAGFYVTSARTLLEGGRP
jgi:chemotaxis protein methyltransferase CheR